MPRYVKGQPPGPGRPPGCPNKSTLLLDALASEGIEDTLRMVQEKANKQGNPPPRSCCPVCGRAVREWRSSTCRR
jgi:hypothetical protein